MHALWYDLVRPGIEDITLHNGETVVHTFINLAVTVIPDFILEDEIVLKILQLK